MSENDFGWKTDENIIQINKFCITEVFLPVASNRHQFFLPVTFRNYLKSTGRQATFRPLIRDVITQHCIKGKDNLFKVRVEYKKECIFLVHMKSHFYIIFPC